MTVDPDGDPDDRGGDPACWLDQVCDTCGRLIDTADHVCPDQASPASR